MVAPASQSLLVTSQGSWCGVHLGNIGLITERDMTKIIALPLPLQQSCRRTIDRTGYVRGSHGEHDGSGSLNVRTSTLNRPRRCA